MQMLRLQDADQRTVKDAPEMAMDCHLARSEHGEIYIVIGGRVAVIMNERTFTEPEHELLMQPWLRRGIAAEGRRQSFEHWLQGLEEAPSLSVLTSKQAWFWNAFSRVTPNAPLPTPPARPSLIYGHLPFSTTTSPDTVIYRWEAFPTSRRIDRTTSPPTIAANTYAAPASEVPFTPTGFAAVARFALPNLMPACFRWELQPSSETLLECGASVPLYGQSGGGVEVKFTTLTPNRCSIADPVILPAL